MNGEAYGGERYEKTKVQLSAERERDDAKTLRKLIETMANQFKGQKSPAP